MNYILFEEPEIRNNLFPFTLTRTAADIRVGILTIREKWEDLLGVKPAVICDDYLAGKYASDFSEINTLLNTSILPDLQLIKTIKKIKLNQSIWYSGRLVAVCLDKNKAREFTQSNTQVSGTKTEYTGSSLVEIRNKWDIFLKNGDALLTDFKLVCGKRKSQPISKTNTIIGKKNIFIEKGARVEGAFLNGDSGPVYIGRNAEVMEGAMIRGPFALGDHAAVKMGAKIYGATTIGPHCKAGGEINNSVFFGYSNKAHDGFIGNSVIGEWCNLGADTNNSNLKNNYSKVKVWNNKSGSYDDSGLVFCGIFMGDHSKCGINTMFNTGTVIGVSANIFGGDFPPKMIPSFAWGGASGFTTYKLNEAIEAAQRMMDRREITFSETDKNIFHHIFEFSTRDRKHDSR